MVVQFRPMPGSRPYGEEDGGLQPHVPQQLLDRHRARVLSPAEAAVAVAPWPAPRSTVYRAGNLLIPDDILRDEKNLHGFDTVLREIGLQLIRPRPSTDCEEMDSVPQPVGLRVAPDATAPAVIDSWTALQLLRAASARENPVVDKDVVARVTVEHLMFGTVDIGGTPWEISGVTEDGSYARSGRTGRIPVSVQLEAPPRRTLEETGFDRRPVIAVLDTGIGPHQWFGMADRGSPPPPDGFLHVFPALQDAIRIQDETAALATPTKVLKDFWDAPASGNPLIGDIDRDTGHGTFIAGIIRQKAPDADVLAVRVLHSDGVAYEADVLLALWQIADRVQKAQQNGNPEDMIDIVSLSLGYFDEAPGGGGYTGLIAAAIDALTAAGVVVVAAAGNDATTRKFYPAALAEQPVAPGSGPQVISVGALNPNGTKALFSNDAPWVHAWATGAAVVSTFPIDVQGSQTPDHQPSPDRSALDSDDYKAGFAVWDGTSFAAPLAAAAVAGALIQCAEGDPALALRSVARATTVERSWAAIKKLG
jgi:hypothetical protein